MDTFCVNCGAKDNESARENFERQRIFSLAEYPGMEKDIFHVSFSQCHYLILCQWCNKLEKPSILFHSHLGTRRNGRQIECQ